MRKSILIAATLAGISTLLAPRAKAQFEHPDLKNGKKVVRTVLVLPAEIKIVKVGVKGGEALVEESRQVEDALPRLISNMLSKKGCQAQSSLLTPETLEQDADLRYALADVQERYNVLREQLAKKSKDVRKGRFTLGDEVAKLNTGTPVDALVFVRGEGQIATGGKKAFSALFGISGAIAAAKSDRIELSIAVVDAQNGAVLYYGKSSAGGNVIKEPDKMAEPIEKSFANFAGPAKSDAIAVHD